MIDNAGKHSIFTGALLHYLKDGPPVFSAVDLGQALREKVGIFTDRIVRMGSLTDFSRQDGAFVFLRENTD